MSLTVTYEIINTTQKFMQGVVELVTQGAKVGFGLIRGTCEAAG